MTARKEIYKCETCGNIVEVLHEGKGELVCCGMPMTLRKENTTDAAVEKHVPVVEKTDRGFKVKVGSVTHPSTPEHYIEWIEVQTHDKVYKKYLNPGDKPEAKFLLDEEVTYSRAFCNLHLLWKS